MSVFRRIVKIGRTEIPTPRVGPWRACLLGLAFGLVVGWLGGSRWETCLILAALNGCLFVSLFRHQTSESQEPREPETHLKRWALCSVVAVVLTVATRLQPRLGIPMAMVSLGLVLLAIIGLQVQGAWVLLTSIIRQLRRRPWDDRTGSGVYVRGGHCASGVGRRLHRREKRFPTPLACPT